MLMQQIMFWWDAQKSIKKIIKRAGFVKTLVGHSLLVFNYAVFADVVTG